jgi:hypothetical protein
MRFRKLRIAWSVFWGLACVVLIALWVRSYWRCDVLSRDFKGFDSIEFMSDSGALIVAWLHTDVASAESGEWEYGDNAPSRQQSLVNWVHEEHTIIASVPLAFLAFVSSCVSSMPWLLWWCSRFSLRTLLIATTLVAVVLGLVIWVGRK